MFDTEEIVVKPVAPMLRGIRFYAGNTILGDGSVVMILDPERHRAGDRPDQRPTAGRGRRRGRTTPASSDHASFLLFRAGGERAQGDSAGAGGAARGDRSDAVEHAEGRPMIQYRGQLMPLVAVRSGLVWPTEGSRPVLVFTDAGRSMGLVVDEIVDIVRAAAGRRARLAAARACVGSAVIDGKATDIVDVGALPDAGVPDWFERASDARSPSCAAAGASPGRRQPVLPEPGGAGAGRGRLAGDRRRRCRRGAGAARAAPRFDAIISDIEMPGMERLRAGRASCVTTSAGHTCRCSRCRRTPATGTGGGPRVGLHRLHRQVRPRRV